MFRREFAVNKPLTSATAYVCGLGLHEFHINGQKVGDNVLEPVWTAYNKKVFYVTYDVTSLLKQGNNAMGVLLGNGFYNLDAASTGARWDKFSTPVMVKKMTMMLQLNYADGTSATIVSDNSWRAAASPITFASIYGGEDYDARMDQAGWDSPGFQDNSWEAATICPAPSGTLMAQYGQPVQLRHVYTAGKPTALAGGAYEFNLTQNIAGMPVIQVQGKAGQQVKLSFREDFNTYSWSVHSKVYCTYTLKGSGVETWSPRFFYYGFQFVKVDGASLDPTQSAKPVILSVQGNEVNSVTRTGTFSCSDTLWNRIHYIIDKAIEGNMQGVSTDCPHREKLGWIEQSHLMGNSIMYNYEVSEFYRKILDDMQDAQLANGLVPDIAPEYTVFPGKYRDSPEWGSACLIGPWQVYQVYGDLNVLKTRYPTMKAYLNYLTSKSSGYLLNYGMGDWYGIDLTVPGMTQLVGSSVYYYDATIMQQVALLLGNTADAATWGALAAHIKTAFNATLFNATANTYVAADQTTLGMPLAVGLVPDGHQAAVLAKLVARVQADGYKLVMGEIGLRFILKALSDNGRSDVVATIAAQTAAPSYGYLANSGRTTLAESMDGNPVNSQFHMMYGHIEEWFYSSALGIAPSKPGYAEIKFKPQVVGILKSATGYVQTPNGRTSSTWSLAGKVYDQDIVVPSGSTGLVYLPTSASGGDSAIVYAGTTLVWKNGAGAGTAPGVTFDSAGTYLVWQVAAGSYHFRVGPPNTPAPTVGVVPASIAKNRRFSVACQGRTQFVEIGDVQEAQIFDLRGRAVRGLPVSPGSNGVAWDGRSSAGGAVPRGMYLMRLRAEGAERTVKVSIE